MEVIAIENESPQFAGKLCRLRDVSGQSEQKVNFVAREECMEEDWSNFSSNNEKTSCA